MSLGFSARSRIGGAVLGAAIRPGGQVGGNLDDDYVGVAHHQEDFGEGLLVVFHDGDNALVHLPGVIAGDAPEIEDFVLEGVEAHIGGIDLAGVAVGSPAEADDHDEEAGDGQEAEEWFEVFHAAGVSSLVRMMRKRPVPEEVMVSGASRD